MQSRVYEFLLDYFPLTDAVLQESSILGQELQRAGMEVLYAAVHDGPLLSRLDWLRLLLRLAYDLGHIDEDVERYLSRSLRDIVDAIE